MIVSVRESKARMSELLAKACDGESVVITVRGKPTARLVPIDEGKDAADMERWADELRQRQSGAKVASARSSAGIIDDLRGKH